MINFNKQNLPFFKPKKGALFSKKSWSLKLLSFLALLMFGGNVMGQISISSTTAVTENFTIGTSSVASLPSNWKFSSAGNGSTSLAYSDNTNVTAVTTQASSNSPTAGGIYNWGNGTTTTDRAIGFMASSGYASPNSIMAFYRNTSGYQINDLAISFDFERYRINTATVSVAFYSSTNGTSWTARNSGDISTSVFTTGTNTYNFTTGTVVNKSFTLTGVNIANNGDFYLMWIITNTGSANSQGIGLDNLSLTASITFPTNYYLKSGGSITTLADWGTATDGTGTAPANFTAANQVFNIRNNATPTIGAAWTVSGTNSKIVVGDGTNACNFTIPALYAVTGTVDVSAGATLTNTNTTLPTLGTLNATSTVVFNAAGAQTVPIATYGNLSISNTGSSTATAAGAITVTTALTVSSGSTFDMSTFALTGAAFTTSGTGTLKTQNTTATPIPTGRTWSMDVLYNSASGQTVVAATHANLNLTGGNRTLIASGTINISGTYTPGAGTLTVTSNTINFNGADGQTIPAATYNILTSTNNTRTLANGVIKIASTFTPGSSNYTIGTSTVEFNGSSAQTIPVLPVASGGNYYNLTYSGSSTGTLAGSSAISISGDLTLSAGTLSVNGTSTTRVVNVSGNFVQSGGTFNGGSVNVSGGVTSTLNLSGNFSKSSGSFSNSATTSSFTLNFAKSGSQSFSNSGTFTYANININSGSTVTSLTDMPNANGALVVAGTLDLDAYQITNLYTSSTVTINGILKTKKVNGLIDATASSAISSTNTTITIGASSTIEYNASSSQTVSARTDYANLTLSGGGAKTLGGNSSVSGTLSLTSGTLTVGANTLTLSGSTINRDGTTYTGNIDASNASATVAFTNTSALTIPASTFTGTCKNITLNGAGGITLGSDLTIGGTLTFTSGKITTGANKVILTSAASVSRTSGHVIGNMQKNVAVSATSRTFEIGDASNYTPITLALTSVTVAGDLTASTSIPGAAPASASGIHPTKYLNRYWTLTNSGITLTSFDPTFTFVSGDIQGSAATSSFVGAKLTSSAWTNPTVGTLTSTSSQLTGATSFGDFYLGEPGTPTVTSSAASSISTTGAVLNGTVNDNGSTTTPGFDYGTSTSYGSTGTTSPSSIAAATGATSVTSTIGSLSVNTQYNFRANATNSIGTTNGSNLTFYTLANTPGTPTVNNPTNTTLDVLIDVNSNPSNTEFAIQETGGINYVQANGSLGGSAVWQTASVWGTKTVTGLSGGTLYTFQVKARNGDNTATSFGTSANGTTSSSVVPTISTPTATAILSTTATLGGNVTSDGGAAITARGVVWSATSLNNAPQLSGSNVTNVAGTGTTGVFTTSATSLPSATQISYSAYATNSQGTSYTTPTTFYTLATEPSTQATAIVFSSQTPTSLVVSWTNGNGGRRAVFMKAAAGSITNPSDVNAYTASSDWNSKGTQLGTSGYYCIYDGTGSTVTVTNLAAATAYYVQVFDYNSDVTPTAATINYYTATATGNPGNSITLSSNLSAHAASFTVAPASTTSLTLTFSAASTITNAAGYIILQKSGNSAPTGTPTNATSYSVGNTIGDGTVAAIITNTATTSTTISGLAYATSYSFTLIPFNWDATNTGTYNYYTAATIPSATGTTSTPTAPNISSPTSASVSITTATLGGNVTNDGGDPVTERGIVWSETSLNADPVIGVLNVTKLAGTGTTGVYTVATTGLTSGVSISYKAYATNNYGTSYTTVGTFTTLAAQPTTQASNITFANVGMNSMTINWTNGNGTNRMVVVKASGAPGTPSDGQTYTANTIFGSGSSFGTSEYVVYTGANNTVDITGLSASITYSVKVFEYNGSGASVNYLTTSNNTSQTTAALTYYSNGSGDPALLASWKTERNGTGSSPANFTSGESFVIESGDVMTTTTVWAISGTNSKLQIESGGTLSAGHAITLAAATTFQIDNGGTYIHNNTGTPSSTIFSGTESFGATSNFRIDNWTSNTTVITTGVTLPFGNLEINYTSNTANWQNALTGTFTLCAGNFLLTSHGSGSFRFSATGGPTITIGGNYTQTAGSINLASSSGVTTLNVGGNFAINGGTFTSTSTGSKVVFNKSGSQSFTNAGTISTVNFEVGASSILDLGTSILSGGSFTIPSGATLKTANASGISGAITATTKSFSSAANYEFNGAATGTFTTTPTASTVNDLTINNSAGVALSQNLTVAGTLSQSSGKLAIGSYTLTLNGAYSGDATNSLTGGSTSNLSTSGTTGTLYFNQTTPGTTNSLNNLTVSSGTATIGNALNITGAVDAVGAITSGGNLTIKSTSATVNGRVAGSNISGNINVERFIPSQTTRRYRFLSSPVATTVADWRGEIFITGGGVDGEFSSVGTNNVKTANGLDWTLSGAASMYGYTENLNSLGLNTRWEAITNASTSLTAGKGYRVFIRGDRSNAGVLDNSVSTQAAVTIVSSGTVNSGTITLPATYNGGTANDGWNLVGNPYPSTIDWNAASGWTKTNVSGTIWIYKPSTNSYGNWDGTTATNSVTQYISSGQAFFVRTTGTPTFTCTEAVKTATAGAGIFKTTEENTLRISLAKDATNSDETVIRFMEGKQNEFSDNDDVRKFINSEVNVSSNFGLDQYAAVNYLDPKNLTNKVVPISAWVDVNGSFKLNFSGVNSFNATPYVMLRDKYLNKLVDLRTNATYQFDITNDSKSKDDNRFEVIFSDKSSGLNESNSMINTTLSVYPNPATDVLNISLSNGTTIETVNIYNVSGKLVNNIKLNGNQIDISQLNNGVYMVEVLTPNGTFKTKFVK